MMKQTLRLMLRTPLLILSSSLLLSACGGGAETTETALLQNAGNVGDAAYSGEVARDNDVLKFQQEYWGKSSRQRSLRWLPQRGGRPDTDVCPQR